MEKFKIENLKLKINKGFTLVEMIIAITLFTLISLFSIGAVLSIFDANKRAQASKTVVDNLNYSIEDMARTIKFGSTYHCGSSGSLSSPNDCPFGDESMSVTFRGLVTSYVYSSSFKAILRKEGSGGYQSITSPEVVIERLRFYVLGSSDSDNYQPYVVAVIKGYSGNKPTRQSTFSIEALMSQRTLDL